MYGNYEDVCDYNSNTVENFALSDYCANYDSRSQDQRDCFAGYFAGKSGSSNNCSNAPCNAGYAGGQKDRSAGGFQMMENPDKN